MNFKSLIRIAACVAAVSALSSCSVLGGKKSGAITPQQKENSAAQTTQQNNSNKSNAMTVKDIAGDWFITSVGSKVIRQDEDMPHINFVPSEGRFYGSNGCNVLNGDYKASGNKITFDHVLSTMKYCANVNYDTEINAVIGDGKTVTYSLKNIGNETYMYIHDAAGKALLTLTRHNMQFINGNWQVVAINGKEINDEEANIFFDVAEMKVHGNTGCNYFNGSIYIDPAAANSISFSGMGVTSMACHKGDQERNMLVALEEATTVVKGSDDTILLVDNSGKQVLKLKRLPIERNEE